MNAFQQSDHPVLRPIPLEEIKRYVMVDGKPDVGRMVEIQQKIQEREDTLKLAEEDPLNHGFDLEHWKYAEELLCNSLSIMCLGGNRSGKTEFGARAVVRAAVENPNSVIVCFAQDEDASVRIQQSAVFRNLPPDLKK